jgi:hypothetical protein
MIEDKSDDGRFGWTVEDLRQIGVIDQLASGSTAFNQVGRICPCHTHNALSGRRKPAAPNPLRLDPSRTLTLRRQFAAEIHRRLMRVKCAVLMLLVDEEAMGITDKGHSLSSSLIIHRRIGDFPEQRFRFLTTAEKVKAFQRYLKQLLADNFVGSEPTGNGHTDWWQRYVEEGLRKGAARAFDDVRKPYAKGYAADESTRDFYDGTKEEFLRDSFARPVAIDKVKLLAGRVFTELHNISETMSTKLTRTLADGLTKGDHPYVVARHMTEDVDGIDRNQANMLARTEIMRVHAEGQLDAMEDLGVDELGVMVEWSVSGLGTTAKNNPSPCEICAPMEGTTFKVEEARGLLPRHPNCLTGESVVRANDALGLVHTHFTGEIIQLVTAKGRRLSVTPNHILLTQYGFLPARFAYKGLKVVEAAGFDALTVETPDDHGGEACIADVFATLAKDPRMLSDRVPFSPEYLHGDGRFCESEISIVWPDSKLRDQGDGPGLFCKAKQLQFPILQLGRVERPLAALGPVATFLHRVATAADSSMGGCRDALAILLARTLEANQHGLAEGSGFDALSPQAINDYTARTPEALRDSLNRHALLKQLGDLSVGQLQEIAVGGAGDVLPRLDVDAGFLEPVANAVISDSEGFGNGGRALASLVTFDELSSVERVHVSNLPVFDVQTWSTVYRVNGLVTSNCMCVFVPANVGEDARGQVRTRERIQAAISRSVKAEIPAGSDRTVEEQKDKTTWVGADATISKARPESFWSRWHGRSGAGRERPAA